MSENQYWKDHVQPKLSPFGKLHRVENSIDTGTPDVAYCLRAGPALFGCSGWVELKHLDELPARVTTPLTIKKLTLDQVLFLEAWCDAGGKAWLLLRAADEHFLFDGYQARSVYERAWTVRQAAEEAKVWASGKFPTGRILTCLTGT